MTEKQFKIKESRILPTPSQNPNPQNQIGPLANNQPRDFPLWPAVLPGPWGRHQRSPEHPPGRPISAQWGGDRLFCPDSASSLFLYTCLRGFCLPIKKISYLSINNTFSSSFASWVVACATSPFEWGFYVEQFDVIFNVAAFVNFSKTKYQNFNSGFSTRLSSFTTQRHGFTTN